MGRFLGRIVLIGVLLIGVLLIVNAALAYRNTYQLREDARWVAHTQEVRSQLAGVLRTLVDAETASRGFAITGKEEFLAPYKAAIAVLPERLARLKSLTSDNPSQQQRLSRLEALAASSLANLKEVIDLRREKGFAAVQAFLAAGTGKRTMDALRQLVDEMNAAECRLLEDRERATGQAYGVAIATSLIVAALGLLVVGAFGWLLHHSLSARQQAAALVHEQREWFRTTLASIGDAVIATDSEGRITFLNAVATELTGWTAAAAAGMPLETVFRIVNETTRRPVDNPVQRVFLEGRVVGLANHTVLLSKDGTERPIDDSAAPIRDGKGRLVGVVLIFRDVAERRRAEEEARKTQDVFKLVHSIGRIGHWEWNSLTDENRWSPEIEALYGLPPGGFEGGYQGWTKLLHPDDLARAEEDVRRSLETGKYFTEFRVLWPDGSVHWLEARAYVFKDDQNKPVRIVGVNMDVTERKRIEEALKEADHRKDEFLATLAHELRNPLAPVRNAVQILQRKGPATPEVQWARDVIDRQMQQMTRLIDDLMDVSRITRDLLELRKERVALARIVEGAVETSRPLIEACGHELTVALPPEPIDLDADLTRLAQVFANLLNNAAKYTERGGQIRLSAERQGSDVVVSVEDTGIGIPADMLPRVFELFTQVDRTLERSQGGLGIGLTLVQRLVEMHGGRVDVHSDGPGKGSKFSVCLPILIEPPQEPSRPKSEEEQATAGVSLRILVVDDNHDAAESLGMLLGIAGHDIRTAHDGVEAVRAASAFRPDVVLLDIGLPKLNGYDAARLVREQPWGKDILLIALTGWGQEEDRRRSKEAGFDHHLVKPVDPNDLLRLLRELAGAKV